MSIFERIKEHRIAIEQSDKLSKELVLSREEKIQSYIRCRYSIEDELALINNYNLYIADNTLLIYKEEYEEYTVYRLQAKAEVDHE